jgi:S1-C subfamily serine protease
MRRVAELVSDAAVTIAEHDGRFNYQQTGSPPEFAKTGSRPYFGSIPDFSQDQAGYTLSGVSKDGPAERAGMKADDIIVQLGEYPIGNLEDFDTALRKFKPGDRVRVTVKRSGEEKKFEMTLESPR